ncbi:hypothetical protein JQ629_33980 [Bradyrhizobium sp. AUGA SZCCT0222]|uniref:outer membrane protein n=1 Tax=Bradyrhizobium sp. AUGA SZCCT0222 TaxID=2807668 RepID=UPI001BA68EF0|nr:hypothetical protein [Bradyrhizobium sp. AUGA SZCCT0222]MBR1272496.1 hypothetical protein [Bradyrhizobium sp. AUGA SZCCT0222]
MKKLVIALSAVVTFSSPAISADMAAKAPMRAAPVAYAPSWTGCYVGAGGGYGMWNQENALFDENPPPRTRETATVTSGGRGYFGTVQGGCDYQFAAMGTGFVVGAFADYDFGSIKGKHNVPGFNIVADDKMSSAWAVGGRVGWLVTPNLLTYFVGGYTQATFDRQDYVEALGPPIATGNHTDKRTYKGWFLGAGDEYALGFLPGLFLEDRISLLGIRHGNQSGSLDCHRPLGWLHGGLQEVHSHRPQRARLSLQLGRPGRCQVLIFRLINLKAPANGPGLFCAQLPAHARHTDGENLIVKICQFVRHQSL